MNFFTYNKHASLTEKIGKRRKKGFMESASNLWQKCQDCSLYSCSQRCRVRACVREREEKRVRGKRDRE